jgi:hypothetical protein
MLAPVGPDGSASKAVLVGSRAVLSQVSAGTMAAKPGPTSTTSVLSRHDSAMPLPETKKSTMAAPPLADIKESVTSTPTVDPAATPVPEAVEEEPPSEPEPEPEEQREE